jgi:putative transposase
MSDVRRLPVGEGNEEITLALDELAREGARRMIAVALRAEADEYVERQRFSSRILPAYARRSPKVGEVIPILYLRGLSTGDFRPALEGLLGEDAAGLSASTVSRLCKEWESHHDRFRQRLLSFSRYAYLFMDGIHVQVRLGEDPKVCLLIVIGVREDGCKELLAVEDGYRESTESWAGVFRDLKRRGPERAEARRR